MVIGVSLHFINKDIKYDTLEDHRWTLEVYDVEATFLNANPGNKMYLKIPDKMVELEFITCEEQQQYAILLENNMYGNVDVALQFFDRYSSILVESLGFHQCHADPCILIKHDDQGKLSIIILMHVDESLIGGRKHRIDAFYKEFSEHLKVECLGCLKKHLGVWWEQKTEPDTNEMYLKAMMPKMLKEIKEAYADATGREPRHGPHQDTWERYCIRANNGEREVKITQYRLIMEKLMYYMTKVAPKTANAMRELAGQMIKPTEEHWKTLE